MFKLFISYSTGDLDFVSEIADLLCNRAEVMYWQEIRQPGADAWRTIFKAINRSDLVVAVITDTTVARAMAVGQEIGHAIAKGKTVVPLVGKGIGSEDLGCLCGVTYVRIDPEDQTGMVRQIQGAVEEKEIEITKQKRDGLIALAMFVAISILLPEER